MTSVLLDAVMNINSLPSEKRFDAIKLLMVERDNLAAELEILENGNNPNTKRYTIRFHYPITTGLEAGNWLGTVNLVSETPGTVSASFITDHGNYCYYWNAIGKGDCRLFFKDCGKSYDYFANKLTSGQKTDEYDEDETIGAIRKEIEGLDDFDLREEESELIETYLEGEGEPGFYTWSRETELSDLYQLYRTKKTDQYQALCKIVLPQFEKAILQSLSDDGIVV